VSAICRKRAPGSDDQWFLDHPDRRYHLRPPNETEHAFFHLPEHPTRQHALEAIIGYGFAPHVLLRKWGNGRIRFAISVTCLFIHKTLRRLEDDDCSLSCIKYRSDDEYIVSETGGYITAHSFWYAHRSEGGVARLLARRIGR
jgi:hypothetical protein